MAEVANNSAKTSFLCSVINKTDPRSAWRVVLEKKYVYEAISVTTLFGAVTSVTAVYSVAIYHIVAVTFVIASRRLRSVSSERLSDKMCNQVNVRVVCVYWICVFTIENGDVGVIDCAKWLVSSDNLVP